MVFYSVAQGWEFVLIPPPILSGCDLEIAISEFDADLKHALINAATL